MWYLSPVSKDGTVDESVRYWLGGVTGKARKVGRKNADIQLKSKCVSREHCQIAIKNEYRGDLDPWEAEVYVTDLSAYGTYIKGTDEGKPNERLFKDVEKKLSEETRLSFGAPVDWFVLKRARLSIFIGEISDSEMRERILEESKVCGFKVTNKIRHSATHVLVEKIERSMNILRALTGNVSIVTPGWAFALSSMVNKGGNSGMEIPRESNYMPLNGETLSDIYVNPIRTDSLREKLFAGFVFVWPEESNFKLEKPHEILEGVGGRVVFESVDATPGADGDAIQVAQAEDYPEKLVPVKWRVIEDCILMNDSSRLISVRDDSASTSFKGEGSIPKNDSDAETDDNQTDLGNAEGCDECTKAIEGPDLEQGSAVGFKRRRRKLSELYYANAQPLSRTAAMLVTSSDNSVTAKDGRADVRKFKKNLIASVSSYIPTATEHEEIENNPKSVQPRSRSTRTESLFIDDGLD
ncbi:hypothetical protein NDN08_008020 [Rhodosorus marinus]|uniref:FHA domain-containing protein n=1 Tax=Rhodosorus marinus TaxID=101924 RepID=A0AAV8V3N4_9RHOD|nr:hypothetical protein NDN08_008020 [Rhodosorus marinus]